MTVTEIEERIRKVEAELRLLNDELSRMKGHPILPGYGPVGLYANDPGFVEAEKQMLEMIDRDRTRELKKQDRERRKSKPARKAMA